MSDRVWICAYLSAFVPGKTDDNDDCPYVSYTSHRHLPDPHVTDRCGWYRLVPVLLEEA